MAVWVDTGKVFGAVAELRTGGIGSAGQFGVTAVSVGHGAADAAISNVAELASQVPQRYVCELAVVADAVTQGAVDVQTADRIRSTGGDLIAV